MTNVTLVNETEFHVVVVGPVQVANGSGGSAGGVGVTGAFPFYKADGSSDPILLTVGGELPFFDNAGAARNIAVVGV